MIPENGRWKALLWASVIVIVASLSYLVGLAGAGNGRVFTGFTYNIDDACVYSSWIRQIADGHVLFKNMFTTKAQPALQFNLFFVLLGVFAKVSHLSPAAVLHIARIILGVAVLLLAWKFARKFLTDPVERALVIPVVGLASGLGWLLPGITGHSGPVDMWQPEAITFLSIYLNPLFLAGLLLMLGALHFLLKMQESGSLKDTALAGLMLLLLGNVHTYDVLTVGLVWAAYIVFVCISTKKIPFKTIALSIAVALIALPSVAYQFYLYTHIEAFKSRVETQAPSPALWAYLMGYGLMLIFAIVGVWIASKQRRNVVLPGVWAVIGFAIPYIPVAQQRKLVMGLHIPIAILAVIALAAIVRRVGPKHGRIVTVAAVLVLSLSNLMFLSKDMERLGMNDTAPSYRPYLSTSELAAMNWLRSNTNPNDSVLAFPGMQLFAKRDGSDDLVIPPGSALFVPAIAGNRVYYGHWSETPAFGEKLNEWLEFVDASTSDEWRKDYLRRADASYVIYFADSQGLNLLLSDEGTPVFDLQSAPYAEVVFSSGDVAVYKVSL